MAVTAANKIAETSATPADPYASASWTRVNGRLYLAAVHYKANTPGSPTVALNDNGGLTWVQVATVESNNSRLTLLRALVAAGAGSGTTELDFSAAVDNMQVHIAEFDGVDTSGTNGSGAIVQSATANSASVAATSGAVTLAAFGDAANNAPYGAFAHNTNEAATPEGGYTELADNWVGDRSLETEWKIGEDTSVSASWAGNVNWRAIAVEIKAAAVVASPRPFVVRQLPIQLPTPQHIAALGGLTIRG